MKNVHQLSVVKNNIVKSIAKSVVLSACLAVSSVCWGDALNSAVDDFNDATNNNLGLPRQFMSDAVAGGGTQIQHAVSEGVIFVKGDIIPPRGQPGWASTVLPLDAVGAPQDASQFEGVSLRVKINQGNLSISANSTEVANFDYHAAPVIAKADGNFYNVKIPFTSMKRAWSEQTPLNRATINSLSIVAYDVKKGQFDFEIDSVDFY